MKDLTIFYLDDCPYCRNAKRALGELMAEDPAYAGTPIRWVEESREPDLAAKFDYYYVPTAYLGDRKLFEAAPGDSFETCKEQLRSALDAARA